MKLVPKMKRMYPTPEVRQQAIFQKFPSLKDDYLSAMRDLGFAHEIWDREYGSMSRLGPLASQRAQVFRYLRDKGWSLNLIAWATKAGCHTTVMNALGREAVK